jgi:hypothetical protein
MLNWRLPFPVGTVFAIMSLWFTQMITTDYHEKKAFSFNIRKG